MVSYGLYLKSIFFYFNFDGYVSMPFKLLLCQM